MLKMQNNSNEILMIELRLRLVIFSEMKKGFVRWLVGTL